MGIPSRQGILFAAAPVLPPGLTYRAEFVTPREELELVAAIRTLPLAEARYKAFTGKRRISELRLELRLRHEPARTGAPDPGFPPPAARGGRGVGRCPGDRVPACPDRGVPRGDPARLAPRRAALRRRRRRVARRLVPSPAAPVSLAGTADGETARAGARAALGLRAPRRGAPRWQHTISPTKALRYSITFRSAASAARRQGHGTSRRS
jgi:hypothetical protein